jgi:hypothetical protein
MLKLHKDLPKEELGTVTHYESMSRRGTAAFQIADSRLQMGGRARPRMVSLVETMRMAADGLQPTARRGRDSGRGVPPTAVELELAA